MVDAVVDYVYYDDPLQKLQEQIEVEVIVVKNLDNPYKEHCQGTIL